MKQIVLKFVVAKGAVSNIMYWMFKHKYTHVAIGLEKDALEFYSFSYSGFTQESRRKYVPKSWNESYAYYILEVTDSAYCQLVDKLEEFKTKSEIYSYSFLALICAFFRIPYKSNTKYSCSYFVAKMLTDSNAFRLKRLPGAYLPNHLAKELNSCTKLEYLFGA